MADKSYAKELVRIRTGRTDLEAYLRELYVDRRWTDAEIAEAFQISRNTVVDWRAEYGISRADRTATVEPAGGTPA